MDLCQEALLILVLFRKSIARCSSLVCKTFQSLLMIKFQTEESVEMKKVGETKRARKSKKISMLVKIQKTRMKMMHLSSERKLRRFETC
jgi:hypothetical protein